MRPSPPTPSFGRRQPASALLHTHPLLTSPGSPLTLCHLTLLNAPLFLMAARSSPPQGLGSRRGYRETSARTRSGAPKLERQPGRAPSPGRQRPRPLCLATPSHPPTGARPGRGNPAARSQPRSILHSGFGALPQSRSFLPSVESSGHRLNSFPTASLPPPPPVKLCSPWWLFSFWTCASRASGLSGSPAPRRSLRGRGAEQLRPGSGAAGAGAGAAGLARCPMPPHPRNLPHRRTGLRIAHPPESFPRRQFYDLQTKLQTNPAGEERVFFLGAAARGKSTITRFGSFE